MSNKYKHAKTELLESTVCYIVMHSPEHGVRAQNDRGSKVELSMG